LKLKMAFQKRPRGRSHPSHVCRFRPTSDRSLHHIGSRQHQARFGR
jgi:hypothetical protein